MTDDVTEGIIVAWLHYVQFAEERELAHKQAVRQHCMHILIAIVCLLGLAAAIYGYIAGTQRGSLWMAVIFIVVWIPLLWGIVHIVKKDKMTRNTLRQYTSAMWKQDVLDILNVCEDIKDNYRRNNDG